MAFGGHSVDAGGAGEGFGGAERGGVVLRPSPRALPMSMLTTCGTWARDSD